MTFLRALTLLLTAASAFAATEIRGVWVERSVMGSRERIREVMRTLGEGNLNVAYVNVWSRGYPLWPSKTFESETGVLIDPGYTGRDPLREAIEEGKRFGVAVIPWVEYGFVGGWSGVPARDGKGPVFDRHPEWLAMKRDGSTTFPLDQGGAFFWMIHTHPDVQEFLFRMMEELARDYDVPAVQFDRARYPSLDCGYDPYTKELYSQENDGKAPPDTIGDAQWMRWRADKLNEFVATLNRRVKVADWRVLSTNAPIVYRYGYVNFVQEYPAWVRQGALDFVTPQVYRNTAAEVSWELDNQIRELPAGIRLVPGLHVVANTDEVIAAIEDVRRRGLPGVVLWFYGSLVQTGAIRRLRETVYSEPATLPWRNLPADGSGTASAGVPVF